MVLLTRRAAKQEGVGQTVAPTVIEPVPAKGLKRKPEDFSPPRHSDPSAEFDSAKVTRVGPPRGVTRKKKKANAVGATEADIQIASTHVTLVGPPRGIKRTETTKPLSSSELTSELSTNGSEPELSKPTSQPLASGVPIPSQSDHTPPTTRINAQTSIGDPEDPHRFRSPDGDEEEALRNLHDESDRPNYADKGKWRACVGDSDYHPDQHPDEDEIEEDELADDDGEGWTNDAANVQDGEHAEHLDGNDLPIDRMSPDEAEEPVHTRRQEDWPKKTGPLTKAESEVCKEFGQGVLAQADELGKQFGKTRRSILLESGLMIQAGRSANLRNQYRAWHAGTKSKTEQETKAEYQEREGADYAEWKDTVYDVASSTAQQQLRKELDIKPDADVIHATTALRVKGAAKQLSSLAAAYNNMEDIEVVGAVIYIGIDNEARKGAAFFGGSDRAQFLLNNLRVSARGALDVLETCLKATKLSRSTLSASVMELFGKDIGTESSLPHSKMSTNTRDEARTMLSNILVRKLAPFLKESNIKVKPKTFPWVRWRQYATDLKVCLVNWDEDAPVPGINCHAKSLGLGVLRNMLDPFSEDTDSDGDDPLAPTVSIAPWDWEHRLLRDTNPLWESIPLVRGTSGKVLLTVGDGRGVKLKKVQKRGKSMAVNVTRLQKDCDSSEEALSPPPRRKSHRVRADDTSEEAPSDSPAVTRRTAIRRIDSDDSDSEVGAQELPSTAPPPPLPPSRAPSRAPHGITIPSRVPHARAPSRAPGVPTGSREVSNVPRRHHPRTHAAPSSFQYPPMVPPNNPYGYPMPYMPQMGMYQPNYPYPMPGGNMMPGPSRLPNQFPIWEEGTEDE